MPNSKQHREKAEHNRSFLDTIDVDQFRDWTITAAFYAVVHLVERLRTREPDASNQHSTDHQDRLQFIQRHHKQIHNAYHALFNASILARYGTLSNVQKQFSIEDVKTLLAGSYLEQIENYVDQIFEQPTESKKP